MVSRSLVPVVLLLLLPGCAETEVPQSGPVELPAVILEAIDGVDGLVAESVVGGWVAVQVERAFWASVVCMEDAGLDVHAGMEWPQRWFTYGYSSEEATSRVADDCLAPFDNLREAVRGLERDMGEAETAALFGSIAGCLRDRGFVIPFDGSESVLRATMEGEAEIAFGECYVAALDADAGTA